MASTRWFSLVTLLLLLLVLMGKLSEGKRPSSFQETLATEQDPDEVLDASSSSSSSSSSNSNSNNDDDEYHNNASSTVLSIEDMEVPMLPAPDSSGGGGDGANCSINCDRKTMKLGETLKLTEAGPMIINPDGTVRRISNWDVLTQAERDNTWRIISARNKKRIEILKQKLANDEKATLEKAGSETDGL